MTWICLGGCCLVYSPILRSRRPILRFRSLDYQIQENTRLDITLVKYRSLSWFDPTPLGAQKSCSVYKRVGRANNKITKDCFPAFKRDAWLQKFKRFNTAIPSSASLERLFAIGSDILRSKLSSMTKENFEKFVLLRENEK